MAITGTGTGPFTITGTETTLNIFNFVVAQNVSNATKNSDNSSFDFNVVLLVGNGTTATVWNSSEESVRIDANSFQIRENATLNIGLSSPSRAGGYWRWQNAGDFQFNIAGNLNAYASRIYISHAVRAETTAVIYFEECTLALLNGISNGEGTTNPTISYIRNYIAGATAVAIKLGGNITYRGNKISGATYAFQPFAFNGNTTTFNIEDHIGQSNTNDAVPNMANGTKILNIIGAFDGIGVPRTSLITTTHASGNTVRLQWKYNLISLFNNVAQSNTNVRIRNVNNTIVFSGVTDVNGLIPQQILTRIEYINSSTGTARFPYQVLLRKYDRTSQSLTFNADNHTTQQSVHLAVSNLTLTQAQAQALTGLTFASGVLTISANRTMAELWAGYRNWISLTANFDTADTWTFDGTTLNIGSWNITNNAIITGNITTTGAVSGTGSVNGVLLDINNAGSISVTGANATDTVQMKKVSDNSVIATRTGSGAIAIAPTNIGISVYFERKIGTALVMSTITTPTTLISGLNANVPLFAGSQVQVAEVSDIAKETTSQQIKIKVDDIIRNTNLIPAIL